MVWMRRERHGIAIQPANSNQRISPATGKLVDNRSMTSPSPGTAPARGPRRRAAEFDHWGQEVLAHGDLDALLDFQHKAPAARLAHPRTEHFAPLFVTLGAATGDLSGARTVIDGFWFGLAKRSIEVRARPS